MQNMTPLTFYLFTLHNKYIIYSGVYYVYIISFKSQLKYSNWTFAIPFYIVMQL